MRRCRGDNEPFFKRRGGVGVVPEIDVASRLRDVKYHLSNGGAVVVPASSPAAPEEHGNRRVLTPGSIATTT